ncbi:hypothetical protein WA026_013592 [Henosepilachna vigintioctopunctata]|uniref:Protein hunchback n=1 Tax=Henosepilachna vigintioctopunctata TaxID=420089 RepID=A0AAW1V987_9CUCU
MDSKTDPLLGLDSSNSIFQDLNCFSTPSLDLVEKDVDNIDVEYKPFIEDCQAWYAQSLPEDIKTITKQIVEVNRKIWHRKEISERREYQTVTEDYMPITDEMNEHSYVPAREVISEVRISSFLSDENFYDSDSNCIKPLDIVEEELDKSIVKDYMSNKFQENVNSSNISNASDDNNSNSGDILENEKLLPKENLQEVCEQFCRKRASKLSEKNKKYIENESVNGNSHQLPNSILINSNSVYDSDDVIRLSNLRTINPELENLKCRMCNYKTNKKDLLSFHVNTIHLKKYFNCQMCHFAAPTKFSLDKHIEDIHLKEKNYSCNICNHKAPTKKSQTDHFIAFHKVKKNFKCQMCDFSCHKKPDLNLHVESAHSEKKYFDCQFCTFTAFRKSELTTHIVGFHLNKTEFKCHLCEYVAKMKQHLTNHFITNHKLSIHIKSVHPNKSHLYDYTTKVQNAEEISHFEGSHVENRDFKCHMCDFAAIGKSNLVRHIADNHLEENNGSTNVCHDESLTNKSLTNHSINLCKKKGDFKCEMCDYVYFRKSSLSIHIRTVHSNGRYFRCHLCGYRDKVKFNLINHFKVYHMKKKNYNCKILQLCPSEKIKSEDAP